jgi:predicted Zn finger-like uncharacterized protein
MLRLSFQVLFNSTRLNAALTLFAVNLQDQPEPVPDGPNRRQRHVQMIVACPACATRYDFPASRFTASGTMVRCVECGHNWIESRAAEVIDLAPRALPAPIPASLPAVVSGPETDDDREIRRLSEAALLAREAFRKLRRQRLKQVYGWAGFAAAAMAPIALALLNPEVTVRLFPASMVVFDKLGSAVNIYGLEVRGVAQQHVIIEGTRVISITGQIVNVSDRDRKVPSLRFTLLNNARDGVYAWTLDSGIRPLRPGEMTTFTTRVASPPPAAENVQIRFAHADEIGVNREHESH